MNEVRLGSACVVQSGLERTMKRDQSSRVVLFSNGTVLRKVEVSHLRKARVSQNSKSQFVVCCPTVHNFQISRFRRQFAFLPVNRVVPGTELQKGHTSHRTDFQMNRLV